MILLGELQCPKVPMVATGKQQIQKFIQIIMGWKDLREILIKKNWSKKSNQQKAEAELIIKSSL